MLWKAFSGVTRHKLGAYKESTLWKQIKIIRLRKQENWRMNSPGNLVVVRELWSPKWDKTDTIAAQKWWRRVMPIWDLTWTLRRFSKRRRRSQNKRLKTMCTFWEFPLWLPDIKLWCRKW